MRIGIGRIWQETNTFSPEKTTTEHFERSGVYSGREMLARLDVLPELSGAAQAASAYETQVELVPLVAVMAMPAGTMTAGSYDWLKASFIGTLKCAGKLDGLFISMHGALAAEGCGDVEGELLSLVRKHAGRALPVSVSLDMHANITSLMISSSAQFTGYHTCPHLDVEETGARAMKMLLDVVAGRKKPKLAWRKIPMVVPADRQSHFEGPLREIAGEVARIERSPGIISASVFAVQPWLDVEELGWTSVVIADGNEELARKLCEELAEKCWLRRKDFLVDKVSARDAVRNALNVKGKPVVISDSADSTNSGAPGNSTWLLKEIVDAGVKEPVFLTMVAPDVARKAHEAGVGSPLDAEFGKVPPNPYSRPLRMNVRVESLHDGRIQLSGHMGKNVIINMGKTAVLSSGNIRVVTSEAVGPGHVPPEFFRQVGLEAGAAKIIVAKSPVGFRAAYEPIAAGIILCESPGPASSDLVSLDYRNRPKPLYPFEPGMAWSACTM